VPARPLSPCLTAAQLQALAAKGIVQADIANISCTAPSLNTCERDANDLLAQYPLYSTGRGVYTAWGAIPLSWDFENTFSNEQWGSAEYVDEHGYRTGDQVLVISDDGRLVTLYTATADGPVPAGPFDPDLWTEVCRVTTAVPVGLPDITELRSRYPYYDPDTAYIANDTVLRDSGCGDHTCVYIATAAVPVNTTTPPTPPWLRLYCVPNGSPSQCGRGVVCGPGRTVTDLSSGDRDLICAPVPYWYEEVPVYDTTESVES
jgi:hypothetical protein